MMVDKEDLGLSLTLGCSNPNTTTNHHHHHHHHHIGGATNTFNRSLQLNLMSVAPLKNPWHHSSDRTSSDTPGGVTAAAAMATGEPRSFLKGIDVNRLAALEDEAAGVSSPNSTISSSVSGKRSEREATVGAGEDLDAERACSRGISDEEDGETSRKKLRLSKDQSAVLEESFKEHSTLNPKQKLALANRLGLRPRQVEVWFQNRRARTKLKQTEVDCEYLKRCCDQLTEENRRLQKEVQELRALKYSPQFYMQMTPATTLTMCPSCERVGSTEVDSRGQGRRLAANPWGLSDSKLEAVRH